MILYLDASALVKRYVAELGSDEVAQAIAAAEVVATSVISRAETVAAFAKAIRVGALTFEEADLAAQTFRRDWPHLVRIQASEAVIAKADQMAWDLGLRGYDAVHLATAVVWQENLAKTLHFATFDRKLWQSARQIGMRSFPSENSVLRTEC